MIGAVETVVRAAPALEQPARTRSQKSGAMSSACQTRVRMRSSGGMKRTNRDESIGSSVNATSSDMATAKAIVRANDLKNCPTIPVMKPTGRKTARIVKVVAMTARPIWLVPFRAAATGSSPISMCR